MAKRTSDSIYVSNNDVSRIIGKGGATIKGLQKESGAWIAIDRNSGSETRKVEIQGSAAQVQAALKLVQNIISGNSGQEGASGWNRVQGRGEGKWRGNERGNEQGDRMDRRWEGSRGAPPQRDGGARTVSYNDNMAPENEDWDADEDATGPNDVMESPQRKETQQAWDYEESGGGGGSGGGWGGDSQPTCYQCHQVGHISRDCPSKQRGQARDITCYKCGETGHISRDCRQNSGASRDVTCYKCNQTGHISRDCPNNSVPRDVTCYQCNQTGHISRDCPNNRAKPAMENKPAVENKPKLDEPIDWTALVLECQEAAKHKFDHCDKIIKDFYQELPQVAKRTSQEVAEMRKKLNDIMVECKDGNIPNPVKTFEEAFHNFPDILEQILQQGFSTPSPIQCQAWPVLLKGLNLIGIAQTGTGKTLAFLLPALIHIDGQTRPREERKGPNVLILSPTRELALQIQEEVNKISYKGIRSVCIYGGGSRREQINVVTKGVEIIVATPGRLCDLVLAGHIDLMCVTYLVLDEADRMLDMGFEPDIRKILLDVRPDRQTVMTSATWPSGVVRMAERYLDNPVKVNVGSLDLAAVHSVTQYVEIIEESEKKAWLTYFLTEQLEADDKVIIFVGRKCVADDVSSDLAMQEIPCQCMHGDREQEDRVMALEEFKTSEVNILVATDLASRGLDVKDITHVLNYDFPRNIEEYVHRIGRTGRAGRSGVSISLMTKSDWRHSPELIKILSEANQEVPPELEEMAERYAAMKQRRAMEESSVGGRRGRGGRSNNWR